MTEVVNSVTTTMTEFRAEIIPLIESKVDKDGTIPILIINPGWGSSGYYSPEVLKEAAQNGVYHAGLHMYWDHPSRSEERDRPERSLRDLAAVFTEDARWQDDGPKGPGLYTRGRVFEAYRTAVTEMGPHIGISHYVWGISEEGEVDGRHGEIITSIEEARSVDFVTVPGRGGAIAEAFRSARPPAPTREQREAGTHTMTEKLTLESLRSEHPDIVEALRQEYYNDASRKAEAAAQQKKLTDAQKAVEALTTENARLREAQLIVEAKTFVESKVKDAQVPAVTKARIVESLAKAPPVKEGKLDETAFASTIEQTVKAEAEYLAKVAGAGRVEGMGHSTGNDAEKARAELTEAYIAGGMTKEAAEAAARRVI